MALGRSLRFGPLGGRTVHLCIDMQNLFAEDTPWHTPWMKRVLAGRRGHRRTPRRADDLHPFHPGATPGRAAGVMAAILPALG